MGSNDGALRAISLETGELAWSQEIGRTLSSPAVTADIVVVGSSDGNVYGLDRTSGEVVFTLAAGDRVYPSPAVVDGWVFFGAHDGRVYAFGAP